MFEQRQERFVSELHKSFARFMQELYPDEFHPVREMLQYHFNTGGKRLRPFCVFLSAQALCKEEDLFLLQHVLPFALAVEMIHNATLIHDDIQDGDEVRRGQATLWKKYSTAQAINCGDLLFFLPQRVLRHYEPELRLELMDVIAECTHHVIQGQMEEFFLKERLAKQGVFPSLKNYEHMARGKTSALFEMPLLGGALLMQATPEHIQELRNASGSLGLAFQIQDDVLDLWGKKGREKNGSDIAEGKLSYPVVLAHELLVKARRFSELESLKKILLKNRASTTEQDIFWAIMLLEDCGAKRASFERFEQYLNEAGEVKGGEAVKVLTEQLRTLMGKIEGA